MDATLADFISPLRDLARSFLQSRNGWKEKTTVLRGVLKKQQRRVADVSQSREGWKKRARAAEAELAAARRCLSQLEADRDRWQRQVAESCEKKAR